MKEMVQEIDICGNKVEVYLDDKDGGAEFNISRRKIIVGTLYGEQCNLVHEILEYILTVSDCSWDKENDRRWFILDHLQLCEVGRWMTVALSSITDKRLRKYIEGQ